MRFHKKWGIFPPNLSPARGRIWLILLLILLVGWSSLVADGVETPVGGAATTGSGHPLSLPLALLFSFLGGVILNLMPCVLPVLSIKILSLFKQAGSDRRLALLHGLVTSFGVILSFQILAGFMLVFRSGGEQLGWGFQLQSPLFVAFLTAFLFVFALSMLGVFEIGTGLIPTLGGGPATPKRSSWSASFLNGVLATVVATPCTAPFMGSALGFAMIQPPLTSLAIFSTLGLGMASPYILLSAFPGLLRFLPRPGPWMESLKQLMGFLILTAVLWLLWVLEKLSGQGSVVAMLGLLLILSLAVWILGRWGTPVRRRSTRFTARIAAASLCLIPILFAFFNGPESLGIMGGRRHISETKEDPLLKNIKPGQTVTYSPALVRALRKKQRPFFLYFTADWCLSCKVNERTVLRNRLVLARMRARNLVLVRGDWTRQDEEITRAIHEYGRNSVPLYVLYGPDNTGPVLLPEILTVGIVMDALREKSNTGLGAKE